MIIYAAIARVTDAAILVDCCDPLLKGNAALVTSVLMEHLRDNPTLVGEGDLRTFVQRNTDESLDYFSHFLDSACAMALGEDAVDENYFHLYRKDDVFYCCLSDDPDARDQKVNFAFLDHVQKEFTKLFKPTRIMKANAYSLDKIFKPNMRSALHYYNTNRKDLACEESVKKVSAQVQDLQAVMNRNINLLLERGENIETLLDKTDALQQDAQIFRRKSRIMLQRQRRKYYIRVFVIFCIFVIFIFLSSLGVCGHGYKYCRRSESNDGGDA
jgi:vesicle-associated membrane protein 7